MRWSGRLILMHLREPAATVRALSRLVRPGGVVSFQDYNTSRTRAVPATPLVTRTVALDRRRDAGGRRQPGHRRAVASILHDAGLSVLGAASIGASGDADSVVPGYWRPPRGACCRWHSRTVSSRRPMWTSTVWPSNWRANSRKRRRWAGRPSRRRLGHGSLNTLLCGAMAPSTT